LPEFSPCDATRALAKLPTRGIMRGVMPHEAGPRASLKVVGVIPARLESVRLPRKPLREICGHPMIAWVYHRARQAPSFTKLLIATDSEEIVAYCRRAGIPVELTSSDHRSGTDRLVEVMRREPADL
jgi:3-deoxy-manno-octulosonate cytidylyltransferase (CMP-KDO synthetase)